MSQVSVTVRDISGTYITSTVQGLRATATSGEQHAVEALGRKLFGPSFVSTQPLGRRPDDRGTSWRIFADLQLHAWCLPSGVIQFGTEVPAEGIHFASGPERALRESVLATARHGRSDNWLLCPGVPEAPTVEKAFAALRTWCTWCAKRNGSKTAYGVWYHHLDEEGRPA